MFRRAKEQHRSAIRLSLFDAVLLAPVMIVPLLIVTGLAVAATIIGDVVRRYWRSAKQPVVLPRRALG